MSANTQAQLKAAVDTCAAAGGLGLGMKRSASGESGAGSAKKQKTALATYQQAQEHMRAQQARQVRYALDSMPVDGISSIKLCHENIQIVSM